MNNSTLLNWENDSTSTNRKNIYQSLYKTQFSKLFHLWRINLAIKAQYIEEKLHCLESILATLTSRKVKQRWYTEKQFRCNLLLASAFTLHLYIVKFRNSRFPPPLPHTQARRIGLVFKNTFCSLKHFVCHTTKISKHKYKDILLIYSAIIKLKFAEELQTGKE